MKVVEPVALVPGSVLVDVDPKTVGLVMGPVSVIDVSIGMPEFTLAVSFVIGPQPLVSRTVGPYLFPRPMPQAFKEVASVDGPVFERQLLHKG